MKRIVALLALCSWAAPAENYLRIEADGRVYTLDTDSSPVRRVLRPLSAAKAAAKLPAWLFPYADAVPAEAHYDVASGIARATFSCAADQAELAAWYKAAIGARGFRVSTLAAGAGGQQITGASAASIVTVTLLPDAQR
ncbi:MAG TPA: hypothetical protein VLW65_16095 [Bryobacteraceae bacterium]|nr:hypothetical protein [Bryobacteraceae bacterium]